MIESGTRSDNVDEQPEVLVSLHGWELSQMTNSPKTGRKVWRKPQLKSIQAGSAEAGSGSKGDVGAGKRS